MTNYLNGIHQSFMLSSSVSGCRPPFLVVFLHFQMVSSMEDNQDVYKLSCNTCDFEGNDSFTVEEHTSLKHENRISDDDVDKLGGMVLTEFFCTLCKFVSDNNDDLLTHSKSLHKSNDTVTEAEDRDSKQPVTPCGSTVDAEKYNLSSPKFICGKCDFPQRIGIT